MTAADQPELIAAAAAAVEAGMEQAQLYQEAAAARPGQGAEVRLPSTPGVVGLSYDTPGDPAPMPGRPQSSSCRTMPPMLSEVPVTQQVVQQPVPSGQPTPMSPSCLVR
jgi:hypothetical protein